MELDIVVDELYAELLETGVPLRERTLITPDFSHALISKLAHGFVSDVAWYGWVPSISA